MAWARSLASRGSWILIGFACFAKRVLSIFLLVEACWGSWSLLAVFGARGAHKAVS